MIQVFHGDGTGSSRKLLQDAITVEKLAGNEIRIIEGDKLAPSDLESILGTSSLFGNETLVIEGLMGRLRSKDKDSCIDLIAKYQGNKNILLWDKKALTKIAIGKLGKNVKATESKAPTALFAFTESIEPGNLERALSLMHEVVSSTEDIIVFTMLARQISYLIMMKSGTSPKFAPWQMGKLRAQASKWEGKELEKFLAELLKIDLSVKTGATKLSYSDHLDLLLTSLLR
jgi:DNA polymerase III delta subunit